MWLRSAAYGLVLAFAVAIGLAATPAAAAAQLTLSPASGPPGTEFVVTGTGFAALPVDIRWGGLSGPVLATAIGPDFSVIAVVPDSPANSHPVMAVVTNGASVTTSSASFQVTGAGAPPPEETSTSTSTSTTIVPPPTTAPPAGISGGESGGRTAPSAARDGASGGVDGGVEPGPAGTAVTTTPPTAAGAGAGSTAASTPTTLAATVSTIPAVAPAPVGVSTPAPLGEQSASTAPLSPDDSLTAAALAPPARTNQSAGAVSNPALLFLGLALVFGGGVFLAVRNRDRA